MKRQVLNRHEFFRAKNVIREELERGYIPDVTYYRDNENDPYTIYIITKTHVADIKNPSVLDGIKNGKIKCENDIYEHHQYVAFAKREGLAKKKATRVLEEITRIHDEIVVRVT